MLDTVRNRYRNKEVEKHPHSWTLPDISKPSRRLRTRSSDSLPSVPSTTVFRDVTIPYSLTHRSTAPPTFEQYPSPGHVAAHLLLLECVSALRVDLKRSTHAETEETLENPCSQWVAYLQTAMVRFKLWITKIESILRHSATFNRYGTGSHLQGAFTVHYLPPLDVLIIWYCYLQNPPAYERLIASNDFKLLSQICFPWNTLVQAIDLDTLEYRVSPAAETLWKNLVKTPFDQIDFSRTEAAGENLAFTSDSVELFELVIRQVDLMEKLQYHRWLRSPACEGTVRRGISRYARQVKSLQVSQIENTQQVPIGNVEKSSIEYLSADMVCQLVLNTHRTFHNAWKCFIQQYNFNDEDPIPPPSYDETQKQHGFVQSRQDKQKLDEESKTPSIDDCYCWICERIKDESDELNSIQIMPQLTHVSSPVDVDEKGSIKSGASDESDEAVCGPDLSQAQIRIIKRDIRVFRHVEALRKKKLRKNSG